MTAEQKQRLAEIANEIERLQAEAESINPYSKLKAMSNKAFGEQWSEPFIRSRVPNLTRENGAGHDVKGVNFQYIEIKSSRIPFKGGWTQNQIHPDKADAYLFVWYNCEEGTEEICFIPTPDLKEKCKLSAQHGEGCYSMGSTVHNREALKEYMVPSFEILNERV